MTSPVDQTQLKAEMEKLAISYVSMQACAIDSLIASVDRDEVWHNIFQISLTISDTIRLSIEKMAVVYHLLRDQP